MKHTLTLLTAILVLHSSFAQNVGIGNTNPSEKLDVNGNMNLTGTLKANGVDGLANQFLMNNGNGSLMWSSINYHKAVSFNAIGPGQWVVPANVTSIMIQAWGGGGGGSALCGGGGGGYIQAIFTVTPGNVISYTVGSGGTGGANAGTNGNSSSVTAGALIATAGGGQKATFGNSVNYRGEGGTFNSFGGSFGYWGMPGADGAPNITNFIQSSSTNFLEISSHGYGGNAGNTVHTGGSALYRIYNVTTATVLKYIFGTDGLRPGGGGGAGFDFISGPAGSTAGYAGAQGFVVINY